MIANEEVVQCVTTKGACEEGLSRWGWMVLVGVGSATIIITSCMPCETRKKPITAAIAHQKRNWRLQAEY